MTSRDIKSITAANKTAWEASAPLHSTGAHWENLLRDAAKPGFSVLDVHLTNALERLDLKGKSAVQIGCNNARELISLASLGIVPSLGLDQSAGFLAQAQKLADTAGVAPRFVEADIYDLPVDLGTCDLALITIGVLNWMPDLTRFFQIVSGLLSPGGVLVIYETHPFLEVFDPDSDTPHLPHFSYFSRTPHEVHDAISYDGLDHGKGETGYWFIHSLGDIVTACITAGLSIAELKEFPHSIRETDYDIYENQNAQIPLSYLLIARK